MRRTLVTVLVVIAGGLQFSCSTDTGPQPGTPAFYWSSAKETFAAGDYAKTSDTLDKLMAGENDFTARTQPWLLILNSGLIRGNMDAADSLEYGVRAKKGDPSSFRKYISNYRSSAGRLSLHFAEAFMRFQKGKDDPITLAFSFPSGSAAPAPETARASEGAALQSVEIESLQKHATERAILLETCRALGAPDDTAKAAELFKSGAPQVPRATFVAAMANSLYEQAQLYSANKLDDPTKLKMFAGLASDALKPVPETKETKELNAKIQKLIKSKEKR
jgi:hypothetical protein